MSDLADSIFKELIAIQVTHGGEIPPELGISAIRNSLGTKRTYFVARLKGSPEIYAHSGHETGMGRTIEHGSLFSAKKVQSPAAIMEWMGGHYIGYEAIPIVAYSTIGEPEPFPPENSVWPDRD